MASINIRAKGQTGEREIVNALEPIVQRLLREGNYPIPDKPVIQRNQNQSAVGGCDLTGTYGLAIEVKRQEALSINTWWNQCTAAAKTNTEWPVLLYRQNGKKWKCITNVWLEVPGGMLKEARAEISWEEFLAWFEVWVRERLMKGASDAQN